MEIIEGYRGLAPGQRGSAAALGNFDGVHLGHQALLAAARQAGGPLGVVTFEPHPRRFFQPDAPPFLLTPREEKARLLAGLGVERLHVLRFDSDLAAMRAEAFIDDVLVGGLGLSHLVVGGDFRFGKGRAGDTALLRARGAERGLGVTVHQMMGEGGEDYASSAVRRALASGDCEGAAAHLGRWPAIAGRVRQGDRRGRTLGYPTANLDLGEYAPPRYGVYAALVEVHEGRHRGTWPGVASIGERPTFGVNAPNFEAHLFDFSGDLYGIPVTAGLVRLLRDEIAFDGVEPLIRQMDRDAAAARQVLAAARLPRAG